MSNTRHVNFAVEGNRPAFTYPRRDPSEWTRITGDQVFSGCHIYGDAEQLGEFLSLLTTNDINLLSAVAPPPANLAPDAVVQWRLEHWGTPVEVAVSSLNPTDPEDYDPGEAGVDLFFTTPWNHPQEGLVALSLRFPELTIVNCWDWWDATTGTWFSYEYEICDGDVEDNGEMDCDQGVVLDAASLMLTSALMSGVGEH